jgi:hypothetical protein
MAKQAGGGPGTRDRGGVRTTMETSFAKDMSKGSQQNMPAPFNAPRAGGDNGLPTHVYDSMGGPKAGGTGPATERDKPGTIMTHRPGQK